jgi:hypothetical protein
LDARSNFTIVKAVDARLINGIYAPGSTPFLEMRITNGYKVLTCHMNLIPGSNNFNCYDILQTASGLEPLKNTLFNKLLIEVSPKIFSGEFLIELEMEVEDV